MSIKTATFILYLINRQYKLVYFLNFNFLYGLKGNCPKPFVIENI